MAASEDSVLRKLFSDVQKLLADELFAEALPVIEKILVSVPGDEDALRCQLVCLVRSGRCQDALDLIEGNASLKAVGHFERAYCLFKTHRLEEALEAVQASSEKSFRYKELEAQTRYRLEQFEACIALYGAMMEEASDDFSTERETNLVAARVAHMLSSDGAVYDVSHKSEDAYELTYNAACVALARGEAEQAAQLLEKAQESCRATLLDEDPDITEAEIQEELGLLRVQHAYAKQTLGASKEALADYSAVLKSRPPDPTLVAVASNNVVSIHKDQDVFDSKKKMKHCFAADVVDKLASYQSEAMDLNHCLLLLHMNQHDGCRKIAVELEAKYPQSNWPCIVRAASLSKQKKTKQALEILKRTATSRPSEELQLAIAHAELTLGNKSEAVAAVRVMPSLSARPAIVSWLVDMQAAAGDVQSAIDSLNEAVAVSAKSGVPESTLKALLRGSGACKLQHERFAEAVKDYERLVELDESDAPSLAQLIAALSHVDIERATQYADALPDPDFQGEAALDVDALEAHNVFVRERRTQAKTAAIPSGPKAVELAKRPRKKRQRKIPSHLDPAATPDPERWVPKWERKAYAARRKKKRQHDVGKGTQGAAAASSAQPEPTTPTSPQPAPQQTSSKKKKGKGRKR